MHQDLVLYPLRQGTYSGPGDIGQLQKVQAALSEDRGSLR